MSTLRVNNITARTGTGNIQVVGGKLVSAGSVLQAATASSGPARQTISSLTPVTVTGLSISFTPLYSTSLILVQAQIMSNLAHVSSFAVFKDGSPTVSTAGQTNNNEPNMNVTTYIGSASLDELWSIPIIWGEVAGGTAARVYDIRGTAGWSGTTYALSVNNRSSNDMAGFSYMTIMEIAQ